jgi:hypothetical protein
LLVRGLWLMSALCARSALASADDLPFQLRVLAPSDNDCTSAATLTTRVASRLSEKKASSQPAPVVDVAFARAASGIGWSAVVRAAPLMGENQPGLNAGERRIDSSSERCGDLDEALVIVLVTFIGVAGPDTKAADRRASEQPSDDLTDPAKPPSQPLALPSHTEIKQSSPQRAQEDRAPPRARVRFTWGLGASAAAATGQLPGFSWGLTTSAIGQWRALTLVLAAQAFPKSVQALGGGAEARFAALLALTRVCGSVLQTAWIQLAPCAGLRAGTLFERTSGLSHSVAAWVPSVAGELGAHLSGPLFSRLAWNLAVAAVLPIQRVRFVIDESGPDRRTYHRVQPGLLLELGVIFRLPS